MIVLYRIGHILTLYFGISGAAVARGWSSFFYKLFIICGVDGFPKWLYKIQFTDDEDFPISLCLLSAVIIASYTILMLNGVKDSALVNNIAGAITIVNIIFVVSIHLLLFIIFNIIFIILCLSY
jgi:hypothetical protein